jgi:hypothetical protein
MVQCHFSADEAYGVILSGPSKDRKLTKHSVLYETVGKIKGKWAMF